MAFFSPRKFIIALSVFLLVSYYFFQERDTLEDVALSWRSTDSAKNPMADKVAVDSLAHTNPQPSAVMEQPEMPVTTAGTSTTASEVQEGYGEPDEAAVSTTMASAEVKLNMAHARFVSCPA